MDDNSQGGQEAYLLNAYRVLLTRARQGMVIFVPPGDEADPTRRPAFYDGTFNYLSRIGCRECLTAHRCIPMTSGAASLGRPRPRRPADCQTPRDHLMKRTHLNPPELVGGTVEAPPPNVRMIRRQRGWYARLRLDSPHGGELHQVASGPHFPPSRLEVREDL